MLLGNAIDGGGMGVVRIQTEGGRVLEVPAACFDAVPAAGQKVAIVGAPVTGPEAARSAVATELLNALLRP